MIPNINTFKRIKNYVYQVDNLLGHGNFSKVFPGKNELDSIEFFIQIHLSPSKLLNSPPSKIQNFRNSIAINEKSWPNLIIPTV